MDAPTVRPTKKQQELLLYIGQFIDEHGYSPSYREIMNGCHYNSVATVALHVGNLIKRGHLRKRDHSARSIEVVDQAGDRITATTAAAVETDGEWLLRRVEALISQLHQKSESSDGYNARVDDIRTLLKACAVLGFAPQAQVLQQRLATFDKYAA